jgi:hypothetical protein
MARIKAMKRIFRRVRRRVAIKGMLLVVLEFWKAMYLGMVNSV